MLSLLLTRSFDKKKWSSHHPEPNDSLGTAAEPIKNVQRHNLRRKDSFQTLNKFGWARDMHIARVNLEEIFSHWFRKNKKLCDVSRDIARYRCRSQSWLSQTRQKAALPTKLRTQSFISMDIRNQTSNLSPFGSFTKTQERRDRKNYQQRQRERASTTQQQQECFVGWWQRLWLVRMDNVRWWECPFPIRPLPQYWDDLIPGPCR